MAFSYFHRPGDLPAASSRLEALGKKAAALAGGTSLVLRRWAGIEHLVDLSSLGLDQLLPHRIGAMVTLSQLEYYKESNPALDLLKSAAARAASELLRNQATVGGSALICCRWSDLLAPLLALNASFGFYGPQGERSLSAAELYCRKKPLRVIDPGELLIHLDLPEGVESQAFCKFGMNSFSHAIWDVAVVFKDGRHFLAVSAGSSMPKRLPMLETKLDALGSKLSLQEITSSVEEEIQGGNLVITATSLYPKEYRRKVLPVFIFDTLEKFGR